MAVISHGALFGLQRDVANNIHFLDESVVLYPAGALVVIHNTDTKEQSFVSASEKSLGITAIAVSPERRYLAVAERMEKGACITVWDLHAATIKKKKFLSPSDTNSRAYVFLAWSHDGKALVALGEGQQDPGVLIWNPNLDKSGSGGKVIGTFKPGAAVTAVSFQQHDSSVIALTGNGYFALFRVIEGQDPKKMSTKPLPKSCKSSNYTAHDWIQENRLVIGTDKGDILLVDVTDKSGVVFVQPSVDHVVRCIAPHSKGFICGGDGGAVTLLEPGSQDGEYKIARSMRIPEPNNVNVWSMAVGRLSDSDYKLAVSLENGQLLHLASLDTATTSEEVRFEPVTPYSTHSGSITGMDVCTRKPLVVTCSSDRTVRVWNYQERTIEVQKTFSEEAYSVAFHPSGFHLIVGFTDKLRLCNVLIDDIRPYKEFIIRGCRECRFSTGGQYFAAVAGNTIQVYNTYTFEMLGKLTGHNGKVRSLSWAPDDTRLYSAGLDGAVYEWRLGKDFKRENENVIKTCMYTGVVSSMDGRTAFAVGSDGKLKEITEGQVISDVPEVPTIPATQVVLSHTGRVLYVSTESGMIRSYKLPLSEDPVMELQCHGSTISRLCISPDDSHLFTASEDGVLMMLNLKDKDGRVPKREKDAGWSDEILVTRTDIEERATTMEDLRTKVLDLTSQNDYQLRLMELSNAEKTREIQERYTAELESAKLKYERLLTDKNEAETRHEDRIRQMESDFQRRIDSMEAQYQQKIMAEVERYAQLLSEKEEMERNYVEERSGLEEQHEADLQELEEAFQEQLNEAQLGRENLEEEKEEQLRLFEETKRQIEEDADREIEQLMEQHEARLTDEKLQTLKAKGEAGMFKQEKDRLEKKAQELQARIEQLTKELTQRKMEVENLLRDIAAQKKEIKERDETIGEKERRIHELKRKNQELEKFKFVLDFKIKGLRAQIEPKEKEIADMRVQIREMDEELQGYKRQNDTLVLKISDLRLKLEGMGREIAQMKKKLSDRDAVINRMRNDIHEMAQHIQDPKALKEFVRTIHERYASDRVQEEATDTGILREYSRQREYLERTVESLRRKLAKDAELHRTENTRIMQENVALIREINELRREIKLLHQKRDAEKAAFAAGSRARQLYPTHFPVDAIQVLEQQKAEIMTLRDRLRGGDDDRPVADEALAPKA